MDASFYSLYGSLKFFIISLLFSEDSGSGWVSRKISGQKVISLGADPELSAKLDYDLESQVIKFF